MTWKLSHSPITEKLQIEPSAENNNAYRVPGM
jgi:hypothetical protein